MVNIGQYISNSSKKLNSYVFESNTINGKISCSYAYTCLSATTSRKRRQFLYCPDSKHTDSYVKMSPNRFIFSYSPYTTHRTMNTLHDFPRSDV